MSYTKLVNGEPVPMTEQEIAERQAEEAAWEQGKAAREKLEALKKLDAKMPRYVEDIIDALDESVRAKLAKETMDFYTEKKTLRERKL